MENTLDDLYFKYIDGVGQNLESDRYFQYLYAMVQAGNNVLQQKHQILKKVVDERWIATIEDSLDAINNIIDKPRRFITTSEEVVPVSLAKKITADSVRHLSMNTQFIATNDEGDIMPSKILNVTTEESYDLYENRFIYHLIYRLIAFVDKRTDVIFWSTGNETSNTLSMESSVDDAYEQINYKIQMTIKNTQSLVENDSDNMQVFMRIDRIRRLVFALRNSAFFGLMAGCSKVQSPIQRTNLMMKDPNYRTCYKLWQFLESYDEVGYTIEPEDSTLEFDEEYMIQMYTNLITNYTVFKSILESDERDLKELEKKKREPIAPKFIKEIKEEIVDSRDIPDVEIRKVFVEEITQAQLDAEAKLEEMTKQYEAEVKNREEAEEAEAEAQRQMQDLYQQLSQAMQQQIDAEDELERVTQEKEEQISQLQEQTASLETQMSEQQKQYEQQIADVQSKCQEQIKQIKQDCDVQVEHTKKSHAKQIEDIKHKNEISNKDIRKDCETQIKNIKKDCEIQIRNIKKDYDAQIKGIKKNCDVQLYDTKKKYEEQITAQNEEYRTQLARQKEDSTSQIESIHIEHENQVEELRQKHEEDKQIVMNQLIEKYKENIKELEEEKQQLENVIKEAENRADKAEKAKRRAEEKSEGTRLSRYIISSITGKNKRHAVEDENPQDEDRNE